LSRKTRTQAISSALRGHAVRYSMDECATIIQREAPSQHHLLHGQQTTHYIIQSDSHCGRSVARHFARNGHAFLIAHVKISNAGSSIS
jgi:hypothetical protein